MISCRKLSVIMAKCGETSSSPAARGASGWPQLRLASPARGAGRAARASLPGLPRAGGWQAWLARGAGTSRGAARASRARARGCLRVARGAGRPAARGGLPRHRASCPLLPQASARGGLTGLPRAGGCQGIAGSCPLLPQASARQAAGQSPLPPQACAARGPCRAARARAQGPKGAKGAKGARAPGPQAPAPQRPRPSGPSAPVPRARARRARARVVRPWGAERAVDRRRGSVPGHWLGGEQSAPLKSNKCH